MFYYFIISLSFICICKHGKYDIQDLLLNRSTILDTKISFFSFVLLQMICAKTTLVL